MEFTKKMLNKEGVIIIIQGKSAHSSSSDVNSFMKCRKHATLAQDAIDICVNFDTRYQSK